MHKGNRRQTKIKLHASPHIEYWSTEVERHLWWINEEKGKSWVVNEITILETDQKINISTLLCASVCVSRYLKQHLLIASQKYFLHTWPSNWSKQLCFKVGKNCLWRQIQMKQYIRVMEDHWPTEAERRRPNTWEGTELKCRRVASAYPHMQQIAITADLASLRMEQTMKPTKAARRNKACSNSYCNLSTANECAWIDNNKHGENMGKDQYLFLPVSGSNTCCIVFRSFSHCSFVIGTITRSLRGPTSSTTK